MGTLWRRQFQNVPILSPGLFFARAAKRARYGLFRSIYEKQPGEAHPLSWRPFLKKYTKATQICSL